MNRNQEKTEMGAGFYLFMYILLLNHVYKFKNQLNQKGLKIEINLSN